MLSAMLHFMKSSFYVIYYYILGTHSILDDILYRRCNKCELKNRPGEVAVITGGARGIGAEVVKKLLLCDMHVVIGCRDVSKGSELVRRLRADGITSGSTSIMPLDMASLDSVQAFANAVLSARQHLHLLINNAGIMFTPYCETVDGVESQWAVNYLSHFLLSHLLLGCLHSTAANCGRTTKIVNISSSAHQAAFSIDFNYINMKHKFITHAAYAQSKLAQIMFTAHLDKALRQIESLVEVVAVHPGIVNTELFNGTFMKTVTPWVPGLLFKTPEEGATTVMFGAFEARGGKYISNGRTAHISSLAKNVNYQQKLFKNTLQTLDIQKFGGLIQ